MSRIVTTVRIECPPEVVFDYATAPAYWPQWHPSSSLSVEMLPESARKQSLQVGGQVREWIAVEWRRDLLVWTVLEYERPSRWLISGRAGGGGSALITYELEPVATARGIVTSFRRELVYTLPNFWLRLLDMPIIRWRLAWVSRRALRQLKAILEQRFSPRSAP